MKLSRILLSTVAIATAAACGNLSKVTDAGKPEYKDVNGDQVPQLVWPKLILRHLTTMVANLVPGQIGTMFA